MSSAASTAYSVLILALFCTCNGQQLSAVVSFNSRGITGSIVFTELANSSIQIKVNLGGLRGAHAWHVHTLPVDQTVDPAVQCLSTDAGPHYDPLNANNDSNYMARCAESAELCELGDLTGKFGSIPVGGNLNVVDNTGLALHGRFSIVGRSVVIHDHMDGGNFECGTIRFMDEQPDMITTLQARFVSPLAGTVYFRQMDGRHASIWGKLYWVDDRNVTFDHNWHVHKFAPGEEYRIGTCDTSGNIGGHYDPTMLGPPFNPNYAQNCTPTTPELCELGDVTGKHNTLTVAASPSPFATYSFFYTDTTLILRDVSNRSLAIHVPNRGGPVVACAPLIPSENIALYSYVNGTPSTSLRVFQISPFEDTIIVHSINSGATQISVLESALNPVTNCLADGGVYSPYSLVDSSLNGEPTPDKLPLGSWGQRYNFSSGDRIPVFDVPIHGGGNTISGKTLRQISGPDDRVCGALLPSLSGNVIIAKASFSRVVNGAIYLIQEDFGFDQLGNTHIIVDIYYPMQGAMMTTGHIWDIHENPSPAQTNVMCEPTIGEHYNPFMVSSANTNDAMNPSQFSNYRDDCNTRYNLRCESGDLVGKHGGLTIFPDDSSRIPSSFVDSNLALTGSFSVVGRSIALYEAEDIIFDCGTIQRFYISNAVVTFKVDADRMLRTQIVRQLVEGTGIDPTDVLVMSQTISELGFGFNCVTLSARVLGPTQADANSSATLLVQRATTLRCNSSPRTIVPLSILLMVACLLLGLGSQ